MEPVRYPCLLTGLEVVFLTDSITNSDLAQGLPDADAKIPVARDALLLLGSAYIEVVSETAIEPGPVLLEITEEQCWLFRSKVRTGSVAIDGKTIIGPVLLCKLFALLLRFKYGEDADDDDPSSEAGLEIDSVVLKLQLEAYHAGTYKDADTDADGRPGSGAWTGAKDGPIENLP